jgi:hypothetical protein
MGNKSSNSEENDQNQLLSKLHQIQEGQDEILRTVAEMSSSDNRLNSKVPNDYCSILYNEFSPNPILTRIRYSQESEYIYSKLPIELGLDQTLKEAHTKMQITLRNHNTTAASFYLIKQLELLCNSSYLYLLTQILKKKRIPNYENTDLSNEQIKRLEGGEIKSYVPPVVGGLRGKVIECKKKGKGKKHKEHQNWLYDITFEDKTTRELSTSNSPPETGTEILYTVEFYGLNIIKQKNKENVELKLTLTSCVKLCLNSIAILNESDEVETRWGIDNLDKIKDERNAYAHGNASKEDNSEIEENIEKWKKLLPVLVGNLPKHKKPKVK